MSLLGPTAGDKSSRIKMHNTNNSASREIVTLLMAKKKGKGVAMTEELNPNTVQSSNNNPLPNTGPVLLGPQTKTPSNPTSVCKFSSVQFLPPQRATVDCNWSRIDPDIEGTKPNHLGPVFCSLWSQFRPIQTGFFAYNLLYQYKPFVSQPLLL
ncbi:uncharacterized protein LACBIDRAFT_314428 [Laccaria bicolor S238N-H82]|uniref:Predicted protein n=1 Tax=Laccaria bicolor (strain S238N-H82 / ATCC MYA-4686) TaxID=486041 RepID=B0DYJ1_LACBS|nr:uncharacterized protein LACBIDRAFT_314428 [Laccaria bicolor S238N-H82]EDR00302.1 predicted protein [Laccaria bicolor S238N-H82]|eukprot:XP_001889054.1 predicted protein [Laccaria bicolor S238N-H82]